MSYATIQGHPCSAANNNKLIAITERTCTFRVNNPSRKLVCTTHMDGCFFKNQACCDFLVVDCAGMKAYFVELKGSDVFKAYYQIEQTLGKVVEHLSNYSCFARIVPTRVPVPNLRNSAKDIQLRKRFRSLGGDVRVLAVTMEEVI